jgi:hypothetical protein
MYENGSMRPIESVLRMGVWRVKEYDGGDESNIKFVNVMMIPGTTITC